MINQKFTRWENMKYGPYTTEAVCPVCKKKVVWVNADGEFKYCPYCGDNHDGMAEEGDK